MKKIIYVLSIIFFYSTMLFSQSAVDDSEIANTIEDEYLFDHAVNANNIDINVLDGIVELTGTVSNIKAKERASNIAQLIRGVRSVSNRISVRPPEYLTDDVVESNVENALLWDPATSLDNLDVSVEQGVVTLNGEVDSYQSMMLHENVAKSAVGVVDLNNEITVEYQMERPDEDIENEIEQALKWNALVNEGLIEVNVNDGEVELTGEVSSLAEKNNAFYSSWVMGVNQVDHTNLEVDGWSERENVRTTEYVEKPDDQIEQAINDAALYDPRVRQFNVIPEAEEGIVTLRGNVSNLSAKRAAENLAENTAGVVGVVNRLKVRTDTVYQATDIEDNIRAALLNNVITEPWEVQVGVQNGVVTLTGIVDSYLEKIEAESVASEVSGVNEVNNKITVNYPYSYYWWDHYPYYELYVDPPFSANQPLAREVDDKQIERDIERNMWWSPYIDSDQVTVEVDNGAVRLEGTVDSWTEYRKALEKAWQGGAWEVDNNLIVIGSEDLE